MLYSTVLYFRNLSCTKELYNGVVLYYVMDSMSGRERTKSNNHIWSMQGWENYCKGTVGVFSSDPPCKDGNAQFTKVPFKDLSDQDFCFLNCLFFWRLLCISLQFL